MVQDSTLNTLNLNMLPFNERACVYRNEIFMSDNFDEPYDLAVLSNNPRYSTSSPRPIPLKYSLP